MTAPLTFLFTDLENSTALWQLAPDQMQGALARHDDILRSAVENHNGRIVKTTGDGFHAVFESARDAILCTLDGQRNLSNATWPEKTGTLKVRMGLHTGESEEREGDYYGPTLNQAARIMGLGYGGQVLLSRVTAALLHDQKLSEMTFRQLGEHFLKGIAQPEEIYQLVHPDLVADFPPLKSAAAPKNNLPTQLTPLIGRDDELETLTQTLLDSEITLVSIIAPGGMGKTRLALELGKRLVGAFEDGVYFIELAPIHESDQISSALSESIGYQIQPGGRSLKQQLYDYLNNKQMLLILDNFEHVMAGATFIDELLRSSQRLKGLVTSRQRLGIFGESQFPLAGLTISEGNESTPPGYAAIDMFLESARRARPDFALTPENRAHVVCICRLVQGMPLGILLAAQWVSVLSTTEIVEEIQQGLDILEAEGSELPDRQRSIRAVFDYAWNTLDESERSVFANMSVFRGGFTRQAGQEVAGAGLRQLQSLISKALISRDADLGRYVMHELLRQYAEEKLLSAGLMGHARDAHARFYLTYLGGATPDFKGSRQLSALKRIEIDFENIRTSWEHAVENRNFRLIGQVFEGMYLYCRLQSRLEDGKALFDKARKGLAPGPGQEANPVWLALGIRFSGKESEPGVLQGRLERALSQAEGRQDLLESAFCLDSLGTLAHYVEQNPPKAIDFYEKCADIYRRLDEKYYLAQILSKLGEAHQLLGQTPMTLEYVTQAYQMQREIGDLMGESESLRALAMTASMTSDLDSYHTYMEKAYAIQLQTNYLVGQASSNLYRGSLKLMIGDMAEARTLTQQGLDLAVEVADFSTQAWCWVQLSWLSSMSSNYEQAARELHTAKSIETDPFRQTGAGNQFLEMNINIGDFVLAAGTGNYEAIQDFLIQPLSFTLMTGSEFYMMLLVGLVAVLRAHGGQAEAATELLGMLSAQPAKTRGWVGHWDLLNQVRGDIQEKLGAAVFEAALERGKTLDLRVTAEEILLEMTGEEGHSNYKFENGK